MLVFLATHLSFGQIISQYVDTDSGTNPKGIEIWNNTGATLDFSTDNLVIERYSNGGTTASTEATINSGTLASGDVLVIGGGDLSTWMANNYPAVTFINDSFSFNGDDALEVVYGGTTTDVFGTIGDDPGSSWDGGGVSTRDSNIGLLSTISSGTTTGFTDPSTRFEEVESDPSILTGFGVAPISASTDTTVQFDSASTSVNEDAGTASIDLSILNEDASNATSVEVALTSGNATDIDNYTTQTVTFPVGSSANQTLTVDITDNATVESDKNLTFTLQNVSGGNNAQIGTQNTFDLTIVDDDSAAPIIIAQEDFDGSTPSWSYSTNIPFFGSTSNFADDFFGIININDASPISQSNFSNNILAENDLNSPNGTTGFVTVTFEEISVESFSNVILSFDWEVIGYNAGNDDVKYEIIVDGVSNGEVFIVDGGVDPDDGSGTVTYNVPASTSTISLLISVRNDGASGYSGFDNFKMEGNYDGDLVYSGGAWTPSAPSGSTGTNDVLVQDGTYTTNGDISVNSISVLGDAAVEVRSVDVLTVGSAINNNGTFTFQSDASGSAQLADATGVTITGNVTVERYFPGRRAFRFVSSSVTTTSSINANWQEGASGYLVNPNPGFGTHITGVAPGSTNATLAQDGDDGFDYSPSGNPSLFTFNAADQLWNAVSNTDTNTLTAGEAYRLMIRGDRSIDVTDNETTPENTKLRSTGELVKGPINLSPSISASGEYALIGNPFQSAVDMEQVLSSSTGFGTQFFYVWDPTLGGENGRGAYTTVNVSDGSSTGGSEMNNFIQPYQAVFLQSTAPSPTLTFEESHKATTEDQLAVFKTDTLSSYFNLLLFDEQSFNDNNTSDDGVSIFFTPNSSNDVDFYDAFKFFNLDENLARQEGDDFLSIEMRALPQAGEILSLHTSQYRTTNYVFQAEIGEFPSNDVFIYDHYTDTQTLLNQNTVTTYAFSVDESIVESIDNNRFEIRFESSSPTSLSSEDFDLSKISMYPNPVDDQLHIKLPSQVKLEQARVFNMLGQKLMLTDTTLLQLGTLESGVYLVELQTNQGTLTRKVIKQ